LTNTDDSGEDLEFYLEAVEGISPPPQAASAAIRLAGSLRRLVAMTVASEAADEILRAAADTVDSLADELAPFAGPSGGKWGLALSGPAGRYLCHPFNGPANPLAPPISVSFTNGRVVGLATYGKTAEGRFGTVHGGCLTGGVAGLVSLTAVSNGRRGLLQSLDVQFVNPAPLHSELRFDVWIEEQTSSDTIIEATIHYGKTTVLTATAALSFPGA
jgi:hypothetical protein